MNNDLKNEETPFSESTETYDSPAPESSSVDRSQDFSGTYEDFPCSNLANSPIQEAPDDNDNLNNMVKILQQTEFTVSKLESYTDRCNAIIETANELAMDCASLKLELVKAQQELTTATGNCQSAINQINASLKDATETYRRLAEDFDANVRQSMLDVVDAASKDLMKNLAKNYNELHFRVERWNKSGAIGGLYFMKYGFAVMVVLELINLAIICLLVYQLK